MKQLKTFPTITTKSIARPVHCASFHNHIITIKLSSALSTMSNWASPLCKETFSIDILLSSPLFRKTFKLNVHFAPKTPVLKPNLAQQKLTCESNANPEPSYGWVMPDGSNVLTERTIDLMVRATLYCLIFSNQVHFSPST